MAIKRQDELVEAAKPKRGRPPKAVQGAVSSTQVSQSVSNPIQVSKITPDQINQIMDLMENGMSERSACKHMGVNRGTFRSAALKNESADHYARALEGLAMDQVEKLESTIEDMREGRIDHNMARVEIDARKWFASKFLPKRFGDKIDYTTNGKDIPTPILGNLISPSTDNN